MRGIASQLGRPTVSFSVLEQADVINAAVLSANVCEKFAIPSGANFVLFSANTSFYMKFVNADIAVPSDDIADGSAPEYNPLMRVCKDRTHISLVAAANCAVTMSFYS